ncbi:MAG: hypothetical protein C4523_06335 [Myxococcales bacterium]|nr:MAG: hypothetical protein C4523_06335 [Myxococcales bacterium]
MKNAWPWLSAILLLTVIACSDSADKSDPGDEDAAGEADSESEPADGDEDVIAEGEGDSEPLERETPEEELTDSDSADVIEEETDGDEDAAENDADLASEQEEAEAPEAEEDVEPEDPNTATVVVFDRARIGSNPAGPNFQSLAADIDFSGGPFANVRLVVDLDTTCYPFSSWQGNPPPQGQNWPADCDAFDRNFEFTLDDPQTEGDPPALELVRAITPFGGPLHFEADITDAANGLPGAHRLRAFISTWSDASGQVTGSNGGWFVSAKLKLLPGPPPRQVLAVLPLYNGGYGASTGTLAVPFSLPEGATSARVEYRATGHGGAQGSPLFCIGPAEEFCRRRHEAAFDGGEAILLRPWRDDCTTLCTEAHYGSPTGGFDYCLENPCGAMASVRAPRANWCPGSVTPPFFLDPPLVAGEHELTLTIPDVAEGGSWRISLAAFIFGE